MISTKFNNGAVLIDRYVIIEYIAAGGMQEVYYCHDKVLDRFVVLKTPKQGISDRRFRRGAEMGAKIHHSNVASTLDYYEDDHLTFMIEEFIDGMDLGKKLEQHFYYLDPHLASHVIKNLTKSLVEAHSNGICHRDLKPSNIMVSNDFNLSKVKLTDFGISKLAENEIAKEIELFEKDNNTLTTSQTLLGAVPYMAPECWDDWKNAGKPMDIWALGCIAYHLVSGTPPFGTGRRAIRDVARYQDGAFTLTKPATFGKHKSVEALEDEIWNLIKECLRADPKARPTADNILTSFNEICYSNDTRSNGVILSYGVPFESTGFIRDVKTNEEWFYHSSEVYGKSSFDIGEEVCFNTFPGHPRGRCATILILKS
ncbi:serine/threonine-protein kinase [Pantoea phytobeneficialis]|uniref:non-specific serine/threonine protein kinase n=1 Tax=Pantoea phytobeneficialis TaxID=2052056 RepID=A0AAP9KQL0_9GAMM|nr:serine/threonine-protein kinase [Pantoea phytobeneficialis]MDO6408681.1 serine/threonine-protein kinase [Pantoea phytobeneficialis]QGR08110.1 protein kinase [Pantoea phytobeneficialis]